MKHLLFICSQNKLRSPTAETIFAELPGVDVDSAGLNHDAIVPLSHEQLDWADAIIVMETVHRTRLKRRWNKSLGGKRIAVLGIPDNYEYMDPDLITLLKVRCAPYLP
ncbi:low molecular weight protein tyrosine phosphatase family protein [Akkermansiaceae bacterium]|nr:low molecular weight protein tyrosine phosphatase family protein [Akkermansiaceae bacterium]MDB4434081.1 low molecular weight protein tyrosine phosphatase family protein [Akkermansiaceae bacterium]